MLNKIQLQFYRQNGYIVLDDIFSPAEIEECSREHDALFESKDDSDLEATWKGSWDNGEKTKEPTSVLSIHSLQNHSAVFTRMLLNTSLLDAIEQILETKDILLHHTKAHNKPPGIGSPFPMHQDYQYFPYKNDSLVAVFIHLDDCDKKNGGLAIYPGSHLLGPQPDMSDSPSKISIVKLALNLVHADLLAGWHYVDQRTFPIENALPVTAKKGQVVVFSYLLVHGSYPNVSDRARRMLLFQLMSAHDEKLADMHRSPCQGMVLRGRNPHAEASIKKRHENSS